MQLFDQIEGANRFIRTQTDHQATVGIILGTGLGNLTQDMEVIHEIPYGDIPHVPVSTVESHSGKLVFGRLDDTPVIAMSGRFHYYEGYSMRQVTFPVRVLKRLGVKHLFISNAAGSTNSEINAGDLVFIRDHINLQPENPLRGQNDERLGVRFPDMLSTYRTDWNEIALQIAQEQGTAAHQGVYVGLQGPNLETPSEYEFLHRIGGDVVGMSTVPEVLVARHAEMNIFVVSVISNKCYPIDVIQYTTLEDVIAVVNGAEPKLRRLIRTLFQRLDLS